MGCLWYGGLDASGGGLERSCRGVVEEVIQPDSKIVPPYARSALVAARYPVCLEACSSRHVWQTTSLRVSAAGDVVATATISQRWWSGYGCEQNAWTVHPEVVSFHIYIGR